MFEVKLLCLKMFNETRTECLPVEICSFDRKLRAFSPNGPGQRVGHRNSWSPSWPRLSTFTRQRLMALRFTNLNIESEVLFVSEDLIVFTFVVGAAGSVRCWCLFFFPIFAPHEQISFEQGLHICSNPDSSLFYSSFRLI